MSHFKGIYIVLLLFLIGCGQSGSDSNKTAPPVVDIAEDLGAHIVIDPVGYTQPNFPLISSTTGTSSIFLNIRNIGTTKIEPVNISLVGMDASFFTFTGNNCLYLYGSGANVCTVGVHFNSAGKMERIYTAELNVNGVKIPFSANYSSTAWNDYQLYGNSQILGDSVDLGKTETQVLKQKIILKHLRNTAVGNVPLAVSNSNFTLNRSTCPASEINTNVGCEILATFDPNGKTHQNYNSTLTITTGNPLPLTSTLRAEKRIAGVSPNFIFKVGNQTVDNYDLGTITVPEQKAVTITIENNGNGAGNPNLTILPNNIFSVTKNTCPNSLEANQSCSMNIVANTYGRAINSYSSRIFSQNNSMILKAYVFSPNNCLAGTHLDPITLNCSPNNQSENIANGTRTRNWIFDPPPGQWGAWSYTCSQPFYEVSQNNDGCIFKRRMLTLSKVGGGSISGGATQLYDFNTIVNLTATPSQYYYFKEWIGDGCSGSVPTCSVTMNQARNIQAVFEVYPVNLSPINAEMYVGETVTFSASGGLPPYSFVVKTGGGNISGNTGIYTAPAQATTATIEVIDSLGNKDNKNLTVYDNLVVTQMSPHLYANSTQMIIVSGGKSPYFYPIVSGSGSVVAGLFTAGNLDETVTIRVSDSLSQSRIISYRVVVPLVLTPSLEQTILVNANLQFSSTGGLEPYIYSVSGDGSISSGGLFTASSTAGNSIVTVTDSLGNFKTTNVRTVLPITVAQDNFISKQDKVTQITPSGGVPPYFYSVVSGTGTISATGVYTAPSTPSNDVIRVTDSSGIGLQKEISVEVIYGVQFVSPVLYMSISTNRQYSATGGLPPYVYSSVISSGNINVNTGLFTAGILPAKGTIRVTDSLGDYEEIELQILDVLDLIIPNPNTTVSKEQILSGTGGLPFTAAQQPYPYKYRVLSGGGTIDASGKFIAPSIVSTTDVEVEDALGTKVVKQIKTYTELLVEQDSFEIELNEEFQVVATGGLPPYSYVILSGESEINSSGLLIGEQLGSVVILVSDAIGQEKEITGEIGVVTYSPDYSNFGSCSVSQICEGTGSQTRTISSCQKFFNGESRVGAILANCSSYNIPSNLSQSCYSPAGDKNVNISNGTKVVSCAIGSTTEVFKSINCHIGYHANGEQCIEDVITYEASYTVYSACSINESIPCSGTGAQSRTISSCQRLRNGLPDSSVAISFCSAFDIPSNLTRSCYSQAGPLAIVIDYGVRNVFCEYGSSSQDLVSVMCDLGYGQNGLICESIKEPCTLTDVANNGWNTTNYSTISGEKIATDISECRVETCTSLYMANPDTKRCETRPKAYFAATTSTTGIELWESNGTDLGTSMLKDIRTGSVSSDPKFLTLNGNLFYFSARDTSNGIEPWVSDGTSVGTRMLKNIGPTTTNSSPRYFTPFGNKTLFAASNTMSGNELWITDGTDAGTVMVKDIAAGTDPSESKYFTLCNNKMFFTAGTQLRTGVQPANNELWTTDGTSAGTVMVKDIRSGLESSYPDFLRCVNNSLLFTADDGIVGTELWKSDGTTVGTVMVKDIYSGNDNSFINSAFSYNNKYIFSAKSDINSHGLWMSDGTNAGTVILKTIQTTNIASEIQNFFIFKGKLYFSANNLNNNTELWISDGTTAGTYLFIDLNLTGSSKPSDFMVVDDKFYFSADDGIHGRELWVSDGTTIGTYMVMDINPAQSGNSDPTQLMKVGDRLYFSADDGINGRELWVSDGTITGTYMVKNIHGTGSSSPEYIIPFRP